MTRKTTYDTAGNEITCLKEFDVVLHPCEECDREDCSERKGRKDILGDNYHG